MGWFSPIKGHYPSLGQIDKTLPVATGDDNKLIERGMIIEMVSDTVNADGVFQVAADGAKGALLYIALQDYKDAQAGMAGTTGFDGNVPSVTEGIITIPGATAGVPSITGLSLSMEGEYETSMFKDCEGAEVGDSLTVENGYLKPGNSNIVGYLMSKPATRWVNNAPAKKQAGNVVRQGANVPVIRFRTK